MTIKDLRNGKFLRCYNNDNINLEMQVDFTNTNIIEPYIELGMDNIINASINDLNKNYNLMKGSFSSPLTNGENPIELNIEYKFTVNGIETFVIQDITNKILLGENRIDVLDLYDISGVSLRSLIGDADYTIVGDFKISGHLKKLPQVHIPYLDLVIKQSPFLSNITVIS